MKKPGGAAVGSAAPPGLFHAALCGTELLQGNLCADAFELRLELLGLFLRSLLLDDLRRGLDQLLGLLQAKAGDLADRLDDLDLLCTLLGQLDVELGLLFLFRRSRCRDDNAR